ncbi:hypothetical protein Bca52824_010015 [Brassica carinata]|uniref:Uncharacterized protein n=1 Tax=Brassica carinata TaxID=52824 RepID=A0A8X7WDE7_BRACI|nr:hypothetical protein Bca52824_010015 [Brassica carinata]
MEKGLRRDVGSGEEINVWIDKWLFDVAPKAPLRKPISVDLELRVFDLICPQTKTWDQGRLEENLFESDIELILKQKPALGEKDAYEWNIPETLSRVYPWVLWMLWKNKNAFLQWFEVHLSALSLNEGDSRRITNVKKWEAPNERFYKSPKLVGVITRPRAWPAFRGFGVEILGALRRVEEGKVKYITREANKCAFMIARSVTNELRLQSYVAQGEPEWLRRILDEERGRI